MAMTMISIGNRAMVSTKCPDCRKHADKISYDLSGSDPNFHMSHDMPGTWVGETWLSAALAHAWQVPMPEQGGA